MKAIAFVAKSHLQASPRTGGTRCRRSILRRPHLVWCCMPGSCVRCVRDGAARAPDGWRSGFSSRVAVTRWSRVLR